MKYYLKKLELGELTRCKKKLITCEILYPITIHLLMTKCGTTVRFLRHCHLSSNVQTNPLTFEFSLGTASVHVQYLFRNVMLNLYYSISISFPKSIIVTVFFMVTGSIRIMYSQ